jgi:hypothetical protein
LYNQEEFVSILISKLGDYGIAEIIMKKNVEKNISLMNQIKSKEEVLMKSV